MRKYLSFGLIPWLLETSSRTNARRFRVPLLRDEVVPELVPPWPWELLITGLVGVKCSKLLIFAGGTFAGWCREELRPTSAWAAPWGYL